MSEENNIKLLFKKYLQYWPIFVLTLLLSLTFAFIYLRYFAIPKYEITSRILIKDKDNGTPSTSSVEAFSDLGLIKTSNNIDDQIGILKSKSLMKDVLEELDLNVSYYVDGRFSKAEVYVEDLPIKVVSDSTDVIISSDLIEMELIDSDSFKLFSADDKESAKFKNSYNFGEKIQYNNGSFQVFRKDGESLDLNSISFYFNDFNNLSEAYSSGLEIEAINETGSLLLIAMEDAIAERGEDIIRELIIQYGKKSVDLKNKLALNTINLIDERLNKLTVELNNVEENVQNYKQSKNLTNISADADSYIQSSDQINRQLSDYQNQIDVLTSIENYVRRSNDESGMVPSSLNIQDPTLVNLISTFNQLQLERKSLLRTTPRENPLVVEVDRKISDLKSNILESLRNVKEGLIITRDNLQRSSSRLRYQMSKVPVAERDLLAINREQGTKQDLYMFLLQKREEEALSIAASIDNTRVVDPPSATAYTVSPNKQSVYLASLVLGLFLPIGFIYLKDTFNDKIESLSQLQSKTSLPILGEIAHNKSKNFIVTKTEDTGPVAELFRLIRFNLKYLEVDTNRNRVLLVTSDLSGEGKTFFSANLANSLSNAGNKVALVDLDLRKPKLLEHLNLLKEKDNSGVSDYIANTTLSIDDIVLRDNNIKNVDIYHSGKLPNNVGDLILNDRVGNLITELRANYDYVVIDSAPVGKVADAFTFSALCDCSIFVFRQNFSRKQRINFLNNLVETKKLKNTVVVLNDVEASKAYTYGNYGDSSYGK